MTEETMSGHNSSREFRGEESLRENDEIDEDTSSTDDSGGKFLGGVSLQESDEMNEDALSEDNSSRKFLREEQGRRGEQEWSQESSTDLYIHSNHSSHSSGTEKVNEYASPTPLKQSWTSDMQLVSMYLDKKHEGIIRKKTYLAAQPELESLLSDYIETILFVQPEDVIGFTAQHFKAFAVQPN